MFNILDFLKLAICLDEALHTAGFILPSFTMQSPEMLFT